MKIILPGDPIPNKRHRSAIDRRKPKYKPFLGPRNNIVCYDAQKDLKAMLRLQMTSALNNQNGSMKTGPLFVFMKFYFIPPASDSIKTREKKLKQEIPYDKKPDLDNIEKFYYDCGNGILWEDDRRIVGNANLKLWADTSRVEIEIYDFYSIFQNDALGFWPNV